MYIEIMEKKYLLGLDVSTSNVGICLFEDLGDEGKLIELTHFQPKVDEDTQLETLMAKANACVEKIIENYGEYNLTKIIVEEPLKNSKNQKTVLTLALFNEYLTKKLSSVFQLEIDFISVHDSRKHCLPELLGKNGAMMSDFPKSVAGLSKSNWSKFLIMYLISQRYKGIVWLLNNALKVSTKNFDRADSIVVLIGFMVKAKIWPKMGEISFWGDVDLSYDRCVDIIEKNVAYEKFTTKYVDKDKELTVDERKKVKRKYLNEVFQIKEYINVDY